ncbi:cell division protein FtsQ/DivIB [Marinirhabdus gelatinilytica]|uniref:Cell division protein FtsQ n=1 Tax=Marinirhabdus gelatinilytica TaxID=1703343 RepID=A0A370Q772_9FLAO|nr:cell division protein FtsQ/DivIB [Marinirhabdus gelatinilytica]RDK84213.1 cell division protein FtsQ [Marinirhabdus gelatinilytica]
MKRYIPVIKFVLLTALVVFLFSFTQKRNANRNLKRINVEFLDENDPFITLATVNKLLVQNNDSVTGIPKETLVLKEMESRLLGNDMIRDAQVYVTVDGVLGAKIEQRNPIGRIAASPNYYLDEDGKKMPLSSVYAARVPLITGRSTTNFSEVTPLLIRIGEDDFMKQSVVGIHVSEKDKVTLKLRKYSFDVIFGNVENMDLKFQNFKAFYKKAKEDNRLQGYKTIDLRFGKQVVATKIE